MNGQNYTADRPILRGYGVKAHPKTDNPDPIAFQHDGSNKFYALWLDGAIYMTRIGQVLHAIQSVVAFRLDRARNMANSPPSAPQSPGRQEPVLQWWCYRYCRQFQRDGRASNAFLSSELAGR